MPSNTIVFLKTANSYSNFQIPIEQLNRASRLLLGSLLEAHDILQQLHAAQGVPSPVEQQTKDNIERVRRLSTQISETEDVKEPKQEERETTVTEYNENPTNELPPAITEQDSAATKASDPTSIMHPAMPDLVPELTPTTPTKNKKDLKNLPDLLYSILPTPRKRATPPRKGPSPAKAKRKVFRLSTLQELRQPPTRHQPLTWTEAGAKLSEVAGSWRQAVTSTTRNTASTSRRRSSVQEVNDVTEEEECKTKTVLSGVVKIVSCVSLYLIVRKMESLLK